MCFFIRVCYAVFQAQYHVHYTAVRNEQYVLFSNLLFQCKPCIPNAVKKLLGAFSSGPSLCPIKRVPIYPGVFFHSLAFGHTCQYSVVRFAKLGKVSNWQRKLTSYNFGCFLCPDQIARIYLCNSSFTQIEFRKVYLRSAFLCETICAPPTAAIGRICTVSHQIDHKCSPFITPHPERSPPGERAQSGRFRRCFPARGCRVGARCRR